MVLVCDGSITMSELAPLGSPPQKLAYLTIDDGPERETIKKIDYLDSKGIKAIWTCQGTRLLRSGGASASLMVE